MQSILFILGGDQSGCPFARRLLGGPVVEEELSAASQASQAMAQNRCMLPSPSLKSVWQTPRSKHWVGSTGLLLVCSSLL